MPRGRWPGCGCVTGVLERQGQGREVWQAPPSGTQSWDFHCSFQLPDTPSVVNLVNLAVG